MFVFSNFLTAVADVLGIVMEALYIVILIRVILSWANADPYNGFVRAIHAVTEPILGPLRRLLPPWKLQGLDISPILAVLAIVFARKFLIATLYGIAARL